MTRGLDVLDHDYLDAEGPMVQARFYPGLPFVRLPVDCGCRRLDFGEAYYVVYDHDLALSCCRHFMRYVRREIRQGREDA